MIKNVKNTFSKDVINMLLRMFLNKNVSRKRILVKSPKTFQIGKVIKAINFMLSGKDTIIRLIVGLIKKCINE